jgi:hypothetical protein
VVKRHGPSVVLTDRGWTAVAWFAFVAFAAVWGLLGALEVAA